MEVVGEASDADELLRPVARQRPDVAVVDIRMPPTHTDEGRAAARRIRTDHPATAVLLLSQYVEPRYAQRLLADQPGGLVYLLKERVSNIAGSGRRSASGVRRRMRHRSDDRLAADGPNAPRLADRPSYAREREILGLIGEGRSNAGISVAGFVLHFPGSFGRGVDGLERSWTALDGKVGRDG